MNGYQCQAIAETYPEKEYSQQDQSKYSDLRGRDGENITDEIAVIFGKTGTAKGSNENAQGNGST